MQLHFSFQNALNRKAFHLAQLQEYCMENATNQCQSGQAGLPSNSRGVWGIAKSRV